MINVKLATLTAQLRQSSDPDRVTASGYVCFRHALLFNCRMQFFNMQTSAAAVKKTASRACIYRKVQSGARRTTQP